MRLVILALSGLLVACAAMQPKTTYWVHPELQSGPIAPAQLEQRLRVDEGACEMEALRIAPGAPVCTANQDPCANAYDATACRIASQGRPKQDCNYEAVNAARSQQNKMFFACMQSRGWVQTAE